MRLPTPTPAAPFTPTSGALPLRRDVLPPVTAGVQRTALQWAVSAWLAVFQAPVGFDPKTFSGPFLTALAFGQFLLPLRVLELVFHAQGTARPGVHAATTLLVSALTLMTVFGIAMATMGMWMPRV